MALLTIVGAGPGISHAVAEKFGKEGFTVALISRNESKLQAQVEKLASGGVKALYAVGNASEQDALYDALRAIRRKAGESDLFLYNVSAVDVKDLLEQDWAIIRRTFEANVGGAFHLIKAVLPDMLKSNKGKLFFTGGGSALKGDPEWTSLGIGKAGMRNLVQAAVQRARGTNVHVAQLTVCGYVDPQDDKYSPDAIAEQYWKLYQQKPGEFEQELIY